MGVTHEGDLAFSQKDLSRLSSSFPRKQSGQGGFH
jgi:hypothetical protein